MIIYFKTRSKARTLAQARRESGKPVMCHDSKIQTPNGLRYAVNLAPKRANV